MGYFKPRTGDREVGGAALSWQELLVVIMSAENQHVLGTPHLIGAFCGEVSVGCVGAIRGAARTGAARRAPSACANSSCNRTLRTDTVMPVDVWGR